MPGMPEGHIATRNYGIMASEDNFVIRSYDANVQALIERRLRLPI